MAGRRARIKACEMEDLGFQPLSESRAEGKPLYNTESSLANQVKALRRSDGGVLNELPRLKIGQLHAREIFYPLFCENELPNFTMNCQVT